MRRSILSRGKNSRGRTRRLKMNAAKQNNNNPAENFESRAPAKANPNFSTAARVGSRHISANAHRVSTEKNVMARSVSSSGPKTRNVGAVAYAARHSSRPHESPSFAPLEIDDPIRTPRSATTLAAAGGTGSLARQKGTRSITARRKPCRSLMARHIADR
jgi:hypothetical protein